LGTSPEADEHFYDTHFYAGSMPRGAFVSTNWAPIGHRLDTDSAPAWERKLPFSLAFATCHLQLAAGNLQHSSWNW